MNLNSDAILFPRLLTAAEPLLSNPLIERIGTRAQMTVGEVESGLVRAQLAFQRIAGCFLTGPVSTNLPLASSKKGVSLVLRDMDQDRGSVRMPRLSYQAWKKLHPNGAISFYRRYISCIQTLERVVLAHAIAGVDISAPEYLAGIESAHRKIVDLEHV